jgi:hypothetical protein
MTEFEPMRVKLCCDLEYESERDSHPLPKPRTQKRAYRAPGAEVAISAVFHVEHWLVGIGSDKLGVLDHT